MAESDVFEGNLISGLQAGDEGAEENVKHPFMLYSRNCNGNGDKADGIFGRDKGLGAIVFVLGNQNLAQRILFFPHRRSPCIRATEIPEYLRAE
jgi:hypothetical protein